MPPPCNLGPIKEAFSLPGCVLSSAGFGGQWWSKGNEYQLSFHSTDPAHGPSPLGPAQSPCFSLSFIFSRVRGPTAGRTLTQTPPSPFPSPSLYPKHPISPLTSFSGSIKIRTDLGTTGVPSVPPGGTVITKRQRNTGGTQMAHPEFQRERQRRQRGRL